jgi:predicted DNA-binding WGR domain protein
MKKLLILLEDILRNPAPNQHVSDRIKAYQGDDVEITLCTTQGGRPVEKALTQQFKTIENPHLSRLIMASETGERAYLLTKAAPFPKLQKLSQVDSCDNEYFWEKLDVQSFGKPRVGMIEALIAVTKATHVLIIHMLQLDEETALNAASISGCQVQAQSYVNWIAKKHPDPWESVQPASASISLPTNTRRFELVDRSQNSFKFWQIALRPDRLGFTTGYGRIGTKGQSKLKVFTTPFACQAEYDKLIQQKLRKGYVEV